MQAFAHTVADTTTVTAPDLHGCMNNSELIYTVHHFKEHAYVHFKYHNYMRKHVLSYMHTYASSSHNQLYTAILDKINML